MPPLDARPAPEFLALQRAVAGRYSLVRELGRGGMGIVFLARDLALERFVAIKLLPPVLAGDPAARERFLREARTAAGLSHPHIVAIHLVEAQDDLVFFVMAYVEGETLGTRVRRAGALPAGEAMRVVQEVAWALAHAHANGVVHRDVKPDNILLDATSGRAMVTDFGIAHAAAEAVSSEDALRGTPQYVSPEVVQGRRADARSDLYALGITAWMAAAGRLPFEAGSAAALVLAHVQTPAPPLAEAARVPVRFARAVDRCLAKDPAARWPSAEALAVELDAARARAPQAPAPVRAFLRDWEAVGGEIGTAATASGVALLEAVALPLYDLVVDGRVGFTGSILSAVLMVIGVLTGGLALARALPLVGQARALASDGHSRAQVVRAQRIDELARADEREVAARQTPSRRKAIGAIVAGATLSTVASWLLGISDSTTWVNVVGIAGMVVFPTLGLRALQPVLAAREPHSLGHRLLRGAVGRWVFRLAGHRADDAQGTAALEGPEPTAIALGQAARELLAALPSATRAALPHDLDRLIDALEATAMRARARDGDAAAEDAFRNAVAALEGVRLDLLRVQVSELSPAELTADLSRVRALGAAVDRQLAARAEVESVLRERD